MKLEMKKLSLFIIIMSLVAVTKLSYAQENSASAIVIIKPYIRETIPGTQISSAYMIIDNKSENTRKLVAITSDISPRIEMHEHLMVGDMMRMRKLTTIEIPARQRTVLQPSGLHLMIFDLNKPLKSTQTVKMTLHFDDKSTMIVLFPVAGLKQKQPHH